MAPRALMCVTVCRETGGDCWLTSVSDHGSNRGVGATPGCQLSGLIGSVEAKRLTALKHDNMFPITTTNPVTVTTTFLPVISLRIQQPLLPVRQEKLCSESAHIQAYTSVITERRRLRRGLELLLIIKR